MFRPHESNPATARIPARTLLAMLAILLMPAVAPAADAPGLAHPARWPAAGNPGLIDPGTEAMIDGLLARMSLAEKVGQMVQADIASITPDDLRNYPLGSILAGGNTPPLDTHESGAPAAQWVKTARDFRAVALEVRPGHVPVPLLFGIDAVHGNSHVAGATIFPHNIGLGAARDPAMMRRIGAATAQETAAAGIDWAFGPTVAVPQDTRWGRSYEGYAQDPELVARYADAMVRGLQGEPGAGKMLQHGHVAASVKHFIADGGTDGGVDQGDARIDEATLIRVHAPGFIAAIRAGALTVMASFSSWQGVKMTGNRSLLTDVLKDRLGFDGLVVSDWNSHGQVAGCTNQSCPAAVNAGLDMFMAPDSWKALYGKLLTQAQAGEIPLARIDDAVRRILRVKARLGLFAGQNPYEGRADLLGSPAHRALAREAVRESLVLLKNNDHVLPIRASARVLVTGPGADDIGMQCGGWTLTWQGAERHNADFPNGQSIHAGLREAILAGGGQVELSADGSFASRPDVAVVVYGESPYAEGWGDIRNLAFEADEPRSLGILQRLRKAGIPVVSVFLSGRPLWTNPQINASDAFVAAWLPGSEGAGIADVIVGDAQGRPRADFHGRLGFSWPADAAPATAGSKAQFDLGYGLRYGDARRVPVLPEDPGVSAGDGNFARYLEHGRPAAPWRLSLEAGDAVQAVAPTATRAGIDGRITLRVVDADGRQEGGREVNWLGQASASIVLRGPTLDMRMLTNGDAALQIGYRVDEKPAAPVTLALGCGPGCGAAVDLTSELAAAPGGQWRAVKIKLSCFRDLGLDVGRIDQPFALRTAGPLRLSISSVQLSSDPAGAVCPARASRD